MFFMSVKEFMKALNGEGVEGELFKTIFTSLVTSFIILGIFYYLGLQYIEDFIPKYGFYLFFAVLSYALVLPSIRHVRAYGEFACMSGMMIGMTIGMIAGFLSGFYVGATNGMFTGSVFGMIIGIFFGVGIGKCCGIMGAMEGIMAGFMGGIMGAMTSVMMLNDNLNVAAVIIFIISASIVFGLNYMISREAQDGKMERKHKDDEFFIIFWSILLTVITTWIMIYGPRSALFG